MPTAAQLRDTLRELVCDELKARVGPAVRCCGLRSLSTPLTSVWTPYSRCRTVSWLATATYLSTQPSGVTLRCDCCALPAWTHPLTHALSPPSALYDFSTTPAAKKCVVTYCIAGWSQV